MYSLKANTSTYIIPLDHIDLKTIHTRLQQDGGTKPLWSLPRNDQEYYRFELIERNTNDLESRRNDADYSTVNCYLCNIKVPSVYVKEHNNTKKHKLCVKITETALQRVTDQILIDNTQSSVTESVEGYFCEPCSIIVTDDHHENTQIHKSSLLHDKLLKDLLLIYSDKDNISKIDIKLPDEINEEIKSLTDNKNENLENSDKVVSKKRTRKCRTRNRNKKEDNMLDESIDDDVVINDYDSKVDNDPKSFKNYLRSLIEMFSESPMEYVYIDENFIQINIVGYKKMLFVDHFLGIIRDSNMCLLCSEQFVEESLDDHLYDFDHMQKVMAPVKDQDCIRQIDATTYYCILCACIITEDHQAKNFNYYTHIQNRFHVINDKGSLIKSNDGNNIKTVSNNASDIDKNKIAIVKTNKEKNKIFCNVCKCNVDETDLGKHYKGIRHLIALEDNTFLNRSSDALTNDDISQPDTDISQSAHTDTDHSSVTQNVSDASNIEVLNYQVCSTSNPNQVKCKVCDVSVPNTTTNIKDHTTGRNHKLKYNELLTSNKIKRVDNIKYFCDFCEMEVPNKNELEHISGKNHQSKLRVDKQKESANVVVSNSIKADRTEAEVVAPVKYKKKTYCAACAVYIDTHNLTGHFEGSKHKQLASIYDKIDNIVQAFVQAAQPKPVDARTEMNNNVITNGATEQNKLKSEGQTAAANVNSPIHTVPAQTNAITETIVNIPQENFLYQMKATENIKTLFCRICKVNVPNLMNDVKIHVNGFNHQTNYSILMTSNKIRKNGDKYICDICKVTVTRRNEIDHVLGRNHQSNIKKSDAK